ncbi:hypothetical protein [Adhaeribacter swui]|nr:hypothetical protein [Adhaeribacter swui]
MGVKQTDNLKIHWEPGQQLNKMQLEKTISYLDTCIEEEQNITKMLEYCVMKVDLLNELMLLENNHHLRI